MQQKEIDLDLDDIMIMQTIAIILNRDYDKKRVELEFLTTLKTIIITSMIDIDDKHNTKMKGKIYNNNSPICYLDQNVFTPFINGNDIN